ncbi:uncharacterized protein THITE_2106741 [Thermothielavioides terrestris NRRL 8126]|uniref:Methyltransferase domain-containing protein n=1 Tax=Thermothielavioides terrestris (strain ATCC 38088 / NRRL 8126) TaxID=578455 RepID=G2QRG4_THETT|nr:uncharacterized protein THITE_2106741 [Thermothielavioides terrestris NRRL 8126]AEO62509.1 hypothetical protein THITE_2106741 [Thermothielavioides terrestris NRRL 8126]
MNDNPKHIVQEAYDHVAEWYLRWIDGQISPRERYAAKVLQHALSPQQPQQQQPPETQQPPSPRPRPRILDLGCGPGIPVTRLLLDGGADVVANDISPKQLAMARERCPQAHFVGGDAAALAFEPASFDGVVSFFTIFHLPRAEQKGLLAKVCAWLKPGALFAFNLATVDEEEIYGEFLGHGMFWSSYGVEANVAMVREAGLEVVEVEVLESEPDEGIEFMWVVARKGLGGEPQ